MASPWPGARSRCRFCAASHPRARGPAGRPAGTGSRFAGGFGGLGGAGGFGGGNATVSSAFARLLASGAPHYAWAAATNGADSAASMELAAGGVPVMAIGGFRGTDPAPSLAGFERLVAGHRIHYYVAGRAGGGSGGRGIGGFGGPGGAGGRSTDASQIGAWVQAHFTAETVGGVTVYNITTPRAGS